MPTNLIGIQSKVKMLFQAKSCFCVLIIAILALPSQSKADEFIIGVEDVSYYPHFDFRQEDAGFGKALLDAFAEEHQYKFIYLPLPIKRFSKWLYEENIDFKYPDNRRWQSLPQTHKVKVYFSQDIVRLMAGTLILAKNSHKPRSFVKNLGTLSGFQPTLWLDRIKQGKVRLLEDPSTRVLVKHLLHGIVDGLDMDYSVVLHQASKLGIKENIVISPLMPRQSYAFQLSTLRHPQVIQDFNIWLTNNQKLVSELRRKYQIANVPALKQPS